MAELQGQKGLGKRLALTFSDASQVQIDIAAAEEVRQLDVECGL
jgi:hypothetical protein